MSKNENNPFMGCRRLMRNIYILKKKKKKKKECSNILKCFTKATNKTKNRVCSILFDTNVWNFAKCSKNHVSNRI